MGREVGGRFRMGNTCIPMPDSCECMAKNTTKFQSKKKKKRQHITSVGENMEKREASCTIDKKCKLLHLLRKKVWKVLKKLKLELPYYPSVVLLSVYVKNMKALI